MLRILGDHEHSGAWRHPERCLAVGVINSSQVGTTILLQSTAPLDPSDVPGYGISVPSHSNELPEVDFAGPSLSPQCTAESTSAIEPSAIQSIGVPSRISNRPSLSRIVVLSPGLRDDLRSQFGRAI